jgi:hypothetical protein
VAEVAYAGALLTYGLSVTELFRRSAYYVKRIFEGAKPADLSVEQPTRVGLVINLKTAKALGVDVPAQLLSHADEVIEGCRLLTQRVRCPWLACPRQKSRVQWTKTRGKLTSC